MIRTHARVFIANVTIPGRPRLCALPAAHRSHRNASSLRASARCWPSFVLPDSFPAALFRAVSVLTLAGRTVGNVEAEFAIAAGIGFWTA